jgi:aminopeptidase N
VTRRRGAPVTRWGQRGLRRAGAAAALILAGTALPAPVVSQTDTTPPPHEPTSYDITIVTSDTGAHLLAEVQTGWRLRSVRPVEMVLDSALRVVRVLVDGLPNTRLSRTMYARDGSEVVVPHEKAPGDTLTTRVRYHGIPRGGFRAGADHTGARALAGETAAGRAPLWLPVPEGEGARASVTWNVQASEGQRVVANGTVVKVDTLGYGKSTWHFRLDAPVPLEALAVAGGRYAVTNLPRPGCPAHCAPVTLWTAPDDSARAAAGAFKRAGEMVDYLSGLLGPLPYPALAHVASSLPPAGRPGASVVLYDESRVHAGRIEEAEVAQATAAQWFGNSVSEGGPVAERPSPAVAAYLALLWTERAAGKRPTGPAPSREVAAIQRLHRSLGDSAFFAGLRRYVERNRNATAEPGAFERAMSEAAGRPLDWSFGRSAGSGR